MTTSWDRGVVVAVVTTFHTALDNDRLGIIYKISHKIYFNHRNYKIFWLTTTPPGYHIMWQWRKHTHTHTHNLNNTISLILHLNTLTSLPYLTIHYNYVHSHLPTSPRKRNVKTIKLTYLLTRSPNTPYRYSLTLASIIRHAMPFEALTFVCWQCCQHC